MGKAKRTKKVQNVGTLTWEVAGTHGHRFLKSEFKVSTRML
jgi:hypothetical protein